MGRRARAAGVIAGLALGLAGCGDVPEVADSVDAPRLAVPLQVYPNQTFVLDARASSRSGGDKIRGYVFDLGEGQEVVVREPVLAHRYATPGTYQVSVRLLDGSSEEVATVEVIACDRSLQCTGEVGRPCPAGFVCDVEAQRCGATQVTCGGDGDCPGELSCDQGACGLGALCAGEFPDGASCEVHADCSLGAFCEEGVCALARCDEGCREGVISSVAIGGGLGAPVLGVAQMPGSLDGAGLYFLTADGGLWRHDLDALVMDAPIEEPPPRFLGRIDPTARPGLFVAEAGSWAGLDVLESQGLGVWRSARRGAGSEQPPGSVSWTSEGLTLYQYLSEGGEPQNIAGDLELIQAGVLTNSAVLDGEDYLVLYQVDTGQVLGGRGGLGLVASYRPQAGAVVCGVATDGASVYLAETRVAEGGAALGASRLVRVSLDGGSAVTYLPAATEAVCGLEAVPGEEGTLYYASWSPVEVGRNLLILHRYGP